MTAKVNNNEATTTTDGELITLTTPAGDVVTVNVKHVTAITDALLAARKEAYENRRAMTATEREAKKAEREAKKAERITALETKLKNLKSGTSGRKPAGGKANSKPRGQRAAATATA